jgi:membrane protease YdiL (CAAX protease family)
VLTTFVLLLASRIIDTYLLNRSNEYLSVVVLQLIIFALPAVVYIRLRGSLTPVRLRFAMLRTGHILLILSATLSIVTGGLLLSIVFGGIDSLQSSFSLYDTFISKNDGSAVSTIYLVMTYAVLPAICEEIVFRSILCAEYEDGGALRAIVFSSVFFGLLHFDLGLLPVYIFAGVMLSLTMYITRSVLASVAAHFLYNLFGLFSQPYITTFYKTTGSLGLFIIIITSLFIFSLSVFCGQAGRLFRRYSELNIKPTYPVEMKARDILLSFASGVRSLPAAICVVIYVIAVIFNR